MSFSRRDFLKSSSVAAGVAVTGTACVLRSDAEANSSAAGEKLNAVVVGVNSRGKAHIASLKSVGGVQITHICDVDSRVGAKICDEIAKWQGDKPELVVDYRDCLANDDIDIVCIATPNHTHSLIGVEALLAGKHVYIEKPVSQNVWEGRQLVNAAAKTGLICQAGTQSRSSQSLIDAVAWTQEGNFGEIKYAIGTCYKARMPIGKLDKPLAIPDHIDYDRWCGPSAKVDLYRPKVHYDWHWDFNTGNGDMGNQGIHQMDIARWFLGEKKCSPSVLSIGGRVGYEDAADTPNTQTVIHGYDKPLIFETRGLPKSIKHRPKWSNGDDMDDYRGSRIGAYVQCEEGYIVIPSYMKAYAINNDGRQVKLWNQKGSANDRHFKNFLDAVRNNTPETLNGPIIEGHISSALCHTGAVSHLLGSPASATDCYLAAEKYGDVFEDSFNRMADHCVRNRVDVVSGAIVRGADLAMDPDTELFHVAAANECHLRKRNDREGYVVPEITV